jgi:hypothetical protein
MGVEIQAQAANAIKPNVLQSAEMGYDRVLFWSYIMSMAIYKANMANKAMDIKSCTIMLPKTLPCVYTSQVHL